MGMLFESLVRADKRFELPAERHLGLVTFRLKVKSTCASMNFNDDRSFRIV